MVIDPPIENWATTMKNTYQTTKDVVWWSTYTDDTSKWQFHGIDVTPGPAPVLTTGGWVSGGVNPYISPNCNTTISINFPTPREMTLDEVIDWCDKVAGIAGIFTGKLFYMLDKINIFFTVVGTGKWTTYPRPYYDIESDIDTAVMKLRLDL